MFSRNVPIQFSISRAFCYHSIFVNICENNSVFTERDNNMDSKCSIVRIYWALSMLRRRMTHLLQFLKLYNFIFWGEAQNTNVCSCYHNHNVLKTICLYNHFAACRAFFDILIPSALTDTRPCSV